MEASQSSGGRGRVAGRLIVFYVLLAVITAGVTVYVFDRGSSEKAQPSIAGGYDTVGANACLGRTPAAPAGSAPLPATAPAQPVASGPQFDVQQSGQFVNLTNATKTLGGKLRLHPAQLAGGGHRLTGTVTCVDGRSAAIDAIAIPGLKGSIAGSLGGTPVTASLKRDPPDAGTPAPRIPASLAGIYKVSPRSTCFGGSVTLAGGGLLYKLSAQSKPLGQVAYHKSNGALAGDVACARGGHARLRASAVDINLNNVTVIPLDPAAPAAAAAGAAPAAPGAKPLLTTPSGLPPSGEKVTAVKQRSESAS